jgi:hypothetical protein
MDETRFSRFALDAAYARIGSRKLCNDASTCAGACQRHGSARQHGSQRFRQPRATRSASRKCGLRRQDKAASHCVVVGFIWSCGQHETAGMQGSGERSRAQRHTLLGYGHRELKQEVSAIGPKQTCFFAAHMSAFGGKADTAFCGAGVRS